MLGFLVVLGILLRLLLQVLEVDPTLPRPITVRIFKRVSERGPLHLARFVMTPREGGRMDESGTLDQLFLSQVRFGFPELSPSGHLKPKDRQRLHHCLSQ